MVSVVEKTSLEVYSTASELASIYESSSKRIVELYEELHEVAAKLGDTFKDEYGFRVKIEIGNATEIEGIKRELKRRAWAVLIDKLGIRSVMSLKRREELDDALQSRKRFGNDTDPVDQLPEISVQSIYEVLGGYAASADEFLNESIHDVYKFLKPSHWNKLKTNEQNKWKVGEKVILTNVVEVGFNGRFRVNYWRRDQIQALDTVFHLLDGKGVPREYNGPLCSAIAVVEVPGEAHETDYFRFKCFKNGSLHVIFKRPDLVKEFNLRCGNHTDLPDYSS